MTDRPTDHLTNGHKGSYTSNDKHTSPVVGKTPESLDIVGELDEVEEDACHRSARRHLRQLLQIKPGYILSEIKIVS